jgi:hypothetical protein
LDGCRNRGFEAKETPMQRWIIGVAAALVLGFTMPQLAMAQMFSENGRFGPRTLGQPIRPRTNQFVGGLQTGESGVFLRAGRVGAPAFATPWRRTELVEPVQTIIDPMLAVRMAPKPAVETQTATAATEPQSSSVYPANALSVPAGSPATSPGAETGAQPAE